MTFSSVALFSALARLRVDRSGIFVQQSRAGEAVWNCEKQYQAGRGQCLHPAYLARARVQSNKTITMLAMRRAVADEIVINLDLDIFAFVATQQSRGGCRFWV
ncbi:hypothetical protein [Methylopila turkensis]|uniref:Uncharacterized protein n=1 Tax=Methylopila turkensis TaxID=1437816 RepID=A0A9W6JM97_9HYPH|nr:hypothetical protein [Methylopila turkensis]GLK78764.1 hypothetical protein GCM10008174_05050 [Methylopila turkensis]